MNSTQTDDWREAHSASDGLVTPFDLNLLTFVRRFLLHGTGPARGLPRLARKGVRVCVTIERRLGSSALRVAIE
jgi:hypothetical protein